MLAVQRKRLIVFLAQHRRITRLPIKLLLGKGCQRTILRRRRRRDPVSIAAAASGHQPGHQRCSSTSTPSLEEKRSHGESFGSNRCVYVYGQ
ncbi:hypothetical protein D3C78_1761530 [compost metagenome]